MEMIETSQGKSSRKGNANSYLRKDSRKYTRYNAEQIEVLEKEFRKCTNPKFSRLQQMISDFTVLANLGPNQIQVWFQNRRCRQKQKKEADSGTDSYDSTGFPQHSLRDAIDPSEFLLVVEETLVEFLSKAIGTAIEWVRIPEIKLATYDIATVSISYNCDGVAARAWGSLFLEPNLILEILKDRLSWLPDCRKLEVIGKFPAKNGGIIELIYMQFYASTTMGPARDFWMLRYTSTLDDGTILVCEKSLASSETSPGQVADPQFTRAMIMSSGYMIRPIGEAGSSIHIVDHLDLEIPILPDILRPLYKSSSLVAQKLTYAALRYLWKIAEERNPNTNVVAKKTCLHSFSHRLTREFNEAISAFNGDGWSMMDFDVTENLEISVNSTKDFSTTVVGPRPFFGGVLCVKTSILLQNVSSTLLIRFLRDHRSQWSDLSVDACFAASLKATSFALSGLTSRNFSTRNTILGHTFNCDDELLERIDFETHGLSQKDSFLFQDVSLLQMCNGLTDKAIGACSELIFAPLHQKLPENAALLSSGFRIYPLNSNSIKFGIKDAVGDRGGGWCSSGDSPLLLVAVFQFPFESYLQEIVVSMAKEYVRKVISSVRTIACTLRPSQLIPVVGMKLTAGSPEAMTLATWIYESYSFTFKVEFSKPPGFLDSDFVYRGLWNHCDSMLCFSFQTPMVCLFANQTALATLETSLEAIQEMTLARIFCQSNMEEVIANIHRTLEKGYGTTLSGGTFMSLLGNPILYQQITAWKVLDNMGSPYCVTFRIRKSVF